MKTLFIFLTLLTLMVTGCSTLNESITAGTFIGGTTGAVLSHQMSGGRKEQKLIGTAIGAGLGALIGYQSYEDSQKKKKAKSKKADLPQSFSPLLKKPSYRMYWVPHQIKGKKFIERHRIWEIQTPSTWSR